MNSTFYEKSIAVILNNQDRNGGYIACPNFKQYQYYWFRDGSFIAYAMDIAGQLHSAERYHTWAINTILLNKAKLNNVIKKKKAGSIDASIDFFHCRFNADGSDADGDWAYHQLDGLGAWLWSFGNHCRIEGITQLSNEQEEAINLVYSYLQTLWDTPCYDCWEEDMNSGIPIRWQQSMEVFKRSVVYTLFKVFPILIIKFMNTSFDISLRMENFRNQHLTRGLMQTCWDYSSPLMFSVKILTVFKKPSRKLSRIY
jgi:GH15 family glucan-1,4-alpha-glucosidase